MTTVIPRGEPAKASAVQPVPAPEVPAAEPAQTPEQTQKLSTKYLEQARLEKIRRKESEAFKAKEQEWQKKIQDYEQKLSSEYIPKAQLEQDAFTTLKSLGWDDQRIMNSIMNQPSPEHQQIALLQAKIKELEEGQKKSLTVLEEHQQKQRDQAVSAIRNKAKSIVDNNPEFELIQKTGSHEAVVQLIVDTWDNEGRAISEEEAAEEIENYLMEQMAPLIGAQKIKSKFTQPQQVEAQQPTTQQKPSVKTLSHSETTTTQKPLSAMSRRERAILAFQGKL